METEKEKQTPGSTVRQGNFLTGGLSCVLPEGRLSVIFSGQTLYCIAFILFIFQGFLDLITTESTIFGFSESKIRLYLRMAALLVLLVKALLFQRAKFWQWLIAAAMIVLGYVTWKNTGMNVMFYNAVFIAFGKDVQVKALAKCALLVYLPCFITAVCLCCAGFLDNVIGTRASGMMRYSMGFTHPNTFALFIFMICISWCVVRFGKKPRSEYVLLAAGTLLCYFVSNSRTYVVLLPLTGVLLAVFYYVSARKRRLAAKILMSAAAAASTAISFYFMVYYTETNWLHAKINTLVSGRPRLSNLYYEAFSLSWLGVNTNELISLNPDLGGTYFLVDNAFSNMIIRYGIVAAVVFLAGIVLFYADQIRRHRWGICLFGMTMFMVLGLAENMTIKIPFNYFLIAISGMLYGTQTEPDAQEHNKPPDAQEHNKTPDVQEHSETPDVQEHSETPDCLT